jgi:peptidoglycan/LPS O-acetylase OafA/YrhL
MKLPSVDALRTVAAIGVVWHHSSVLPISSSLVGLGSGFAFFVDKIAINLARVIEEGREPL